MRIAHGNLCFDQTHILCTVREIVDEFTAVYAELLFENSDCVFACAVEHGASWQRFFLRRELSDFARCSMRDAQFSNRHIAHDEERALLYQQ